MKANELRIDNLVLYNGIVMKISEICSPKPLKDKKYSDKYIIELFDGAGLINCVIDYINSVPITEEWLFKFGFEKIEDTSWYCEYRIDKKNIVSFDKDDKEYSYFNLSSRLCRLQYVHQLQNLYFALTQEELKIK